MMECDVMITELLYFSRYFFSFIHSCTHASSSAHIEHIRQIAGVDHVGIGAGFDGINL